MIIIDQIIDFLEWLWRMPDLPNALPVVEAKSRGERNNNPLNIRKSDSPYVGQVGIDESGYLIFDEPLRGLRAGMVTLRTYFLKHNLRTVKGVIYRWAPPADRNPTDAYIAYVCKELRVLPDAVLIFDSVVVQLTHAMVQFETGKDPYPLTLYRAAKAML